jgi:hypothetical protein
MTFTTFIYQRNHLAKTRNERALGHQKSIQKGVANGIPALSDMTDGIPAIRNVIGKGVYVFYLVNGERYYYQLTKGTP